MVVAGHPERRPKSEAVSAASLSGAASRALEKPSLLPRDLLPWAEGSTQVDLTVSFENPPTTIYFEVKYLANLSPHVTNGHAGFPSVTVPVRLPFGDQAGVLFVAFGRIVRAEVMVVAGDGDDGTIPGLVETLRRLTRRTFG